MEIDVEDYYRKHGPMVLRRCRRLLRDEENAVDAMHDTFVNLLRAGNRLSDEAPASLLLRIATRVCLNRLRTQRRHPEDRDREGRFELAGVPEGAVKVVVTEAAHARFETTEVVEPGRVTELGLWVRKTLQGAYEAVVVGAKEKEVSHVAISAGEIQRVPGVSGDGPRALHHAALRRLADLDRGPGLARRDGLAGGGARGWPVTRPSA